MIHGLAGAAASAPVTAWGPRLALTITVLAIIGLGVWGMRRGWQARAARQADLPAPAAPPELSDGPVAGMAGAPVLGMYVATTRAGDLLDRIVVHGLGNRGRAELSLDPRGVRISRVGEAPVWIPVDDLRDVRLGSGQAQKAYEAGGLILIRWRLGDAEVETGFRADDPEQHLTTAGALSALVPSTGGPR